MQFIHKTLLTMPVAITSYADVEDYIIHHSHKKQGRYICVSNVHMCMEAYDSTSFNEVVNNADLVVPDGRPLVWALKCFGEKNATQVRGADLFFHLCKKAEILQISIGLYGGTPESLLKLLCFLKETFPDLPIAYHHSPPFRELSRSERETCIKEIKASGARILFVAIGCPKQEKWMADHKKALDCVMIGVGAAFDFFSGQKKHAPRWIQKAGMEWFFRLVNDPERLWKRYFKHNPRFIFHFVRQLVNRKKNLL